MLHGDLYHFQLSLFFHFMTKQSKNNLQVKLILKLIRPSVTFDLRHQLLTQQFCLYHRKGFQSVSETSMTASHHQHLVFKIIQPQLFPLQETSPSVQLKISQRSTKCKTAIFSFLLSGRSKEDKTTLRVL